MTKVFAWDIDFFRDPRKGDAFSLLVEKKYGEDGSFRGYGQVLSAKYVNRGQEFYGILYKGSYFNEEGRSMEKMLMKAPAQFRPGDLGFLRRAPASRAGREAPALGHRLRRARWAPRSWPPATA